ncbi:MAG: AAA family ATPase [Bacteroidales bacterium]|nr:AAA family ATPase [Bacteroidales bacterium]
MKKGQSDRKASVKVEVTVLSVDRMGRVITSGCDEFEFGLLIPQNILFDYTPASIENAIFYIKNHFVSGMKVSVTIETIIKNSFNLSIAVLTLNIKNASIVSSNKKWLQEGDVSETVVVDSISDYYKLSLFGLSTIGYIEKSAFNEGKINIGDVLQLRLDHKGGNILQYSHFIPIEDSNKIQTVNNVKLNKKETQKIFENFFTDTERRLLPENYVDFFLSLVEKYPNICRGNTSLKDLNCLYCRYDPKLEIIFSNFYKRNPSFFIESSYWVKYYKEFEKEYLLLFNSDDIVILVRFENNTLIVKNIYYNRTNQAAKKLLEENTDACLILEKGKLHILNKFQPIPYGFSADDALDYISDLQSFHSDFLYDLKEDLNGFRKNNATEFNILKEIIDFNIYLEEKKNNSIVFVPKESNINRVASTVYKTGVSFQFHLSPSKYACLVNEETEDITYVSITDEKGKPLRSGLLFYDVEAKKACLEFPNKDKSIDSSKVREGFYLKRRNQTEHLQLQKEAISTFIKNKGASFYDDMMNGSLPIPVITDEINSIVFFDKKLQDASMDNSQPTAVKKALGNKKLVLIQGPPGTGKTTVIVEIVRQLVKQGKKVLVCSQAHAAVDNIVEKLKGIPIEEQNILSMSIGNEGEEESWGEGFNSEDYKSFLYNNELLISHLNDEIEERDIRQDIENKFVYGNSVIKQYKESHEYILNNYNSTSKQLYKNSIPILDKLLKESNKLSQNLLEACRYQTMDVILGTCIGIGMNKILRRGIIKFDTVIIDEAAKANLAESIVPLNLGERYVLVGDDKQLPPYYDSDMIDEFISYLSCRSDEKYERNDILSAATTSLFQKAHQSNTFPQECVTMLNYQHRMHPDIGEFISNTFYDGKVNMGQNTVMQKLSLPSSPFDKQVVFVDTNSGNEKVGGFSPYDRFENNSYCNDLESEIISKEIIPLLQRDVDFNEVTIGIITPYRAQRDLLRHNIDSIDLKNSVFTIDSIQGREFDIVIFSFVRAFRPNSTRNVGFLDDMRRLNVSLSRAKKKLILVGHKSTLTNPDFHIKQDSVGIKPFEVFDRLSTYSTTFSQKTKGEVFTEKYHIGDVIPCVIEKIENNTVYVFFKDDTNFRYPITLKNKYYIESLVKSRSLYIQFRSFNSNRKPNFNIVSYDDIEGVNHKVISIESYLETFPLGKEVLVKFVERDERGNIEVQHIGYQGKIPRNAYPVGYYDNITEGQEIPARVYFVDTISQTISFCPVFKENITPYILNGKIKNFICKLISKPSFGNIELEFDEGYSFVFCISQPSLWWNFLDIGKIYGSIGYDTKKNNAIVFRKIYFTDFLKNCSEGDCVRGTLVHKGRYSVAIVNNFPGYILEGDLRRYKEGDQCTFIVSEINEEQSYVTFKAIKNL